jgi:hypothetical protein
MYKCYKTEWRAACKVQQPVWPGTSWDQSSTRIWLFAIMVFLRLVIDVEEQCSYYGNQSDIAKITHK